MRKSFLKVVGIAAILTVVLALGSCTLFTGSAVSEPFEVYVSSEAVEQCDLSSVEEQIFPHISYSLPFKIYAKRLNLNSTIKAGRYRFEGGESVIRIVRMLKLGEQATLNVTFNNVRTMEDLAGRVSSQLAVDSLTLLNYLQKKDVAEKYGFKTTEELFAMFIPNTYQFYWNASPQHFVERMHTEYNKFWSDDRVEKARAKRLTRVEVMTLASIVYEETKQSSEMARVAGVYTNRLRIGMPLQADPTVKYALQDFTIKRLLYKHLECDSPYNTYKHKGLPPSPIAMPSIEAIDAVLSAERHNYLYFCARPTFDGYHNFARTLSEHNANAAAYINELNRLKIK